jgi:ParB-like chromosome segregation protein Spo0J
MTIDDLEQGIRELSSLPTHERIQAINRLMEVIGEIHPNTDPVSSVRWVPASMIEANSYNPNAVMPPEMRLLYLSIKEDGYTQPIVVFWDEERKKYIVVDGFHRDLVGKEYRDIRERTHGYLPIVTIKKSLAERMASTIRHNRARGKHAVLGMVDLVVALVNEGLSDAEIGKQLGMDADEVLRLKQTSGIPALFKNRSYSRSWILAQDGQQNDPSEGDEPEGHKEPPAWI